MRILIADDNALDRFVLDAMLKKMGHEVLIAEDGRQAWEILQKEYIPVVVSDWLMPQMDGLELCRAIRAAQQDAYTYIILLTALGGKTNYLEAIDAGTDDFMTKPPDEEQLAARLQVAERIVGLRRYVSQVEGLLPMCSYCKKIRTDESIWEPVDVYVAKRSKAEFTHGICPECMEGVVKPQLVEFRREREKRGQSGT